jgi:hypothetical protein
MPSTNCGEAIPEEALGAFLEDLEDEKDDEGVPNGSA